MLVGYIRTRKGRISEADQKKLLLKFGVPDVPDEKTIFVDHPKYETQSPKPDQLTERAEMLRSLNEGDTVVVANYATLGLDGTDFIYAIGRVLSRKAKIHFCEDKDTIDWQAPFAEAAEALAERATEAQASLARERTSKAREVKGPVGRPSIEKDRLEEFRDAWFNQHNLTATEIAAQAGVSRALLTKYFGPIKQCRSGTS